MEVKETSLGATRTTGPYRLCSSWIYTVRLALSSCHFSTSEVKLDMNGPGTFAVAEQRRMIR